ncbi:MAG TPA: DegT/DnrJ/EryC1/StrS family aminotransferase, partial [Phenylobacterium sp.]|nr:DegT/DnrJ/EryC1/StrS family aminotransferase [Phenylobacterium sp.]
KLDRFVSARRALSLAYARRLEGLSPHLRLAHDPEWSRTAPHLLTILADFEALGVSRRAVIEGLARQGIGAQVHYIPVHTQPYYRRRYGDQALPGAAAWYARALSLPLYPGLDEAGVERVVSGLARTLGLGGRI